MEPTPWHWSKHLKFRPSWQFHTGCLSLHGCQTAILPHVGTLNSAYWAFSYNIHSSKGFSCSINLRKHRTTLMSTKACFRGKAFLGKPATITFGKNKDVNSWIKFRLLYYKSFAPALGGACAMGTNTMALIQTSQIQAIMTVPHRLSFSARLTNCNLATCWHIELSILGLLIQHSFEQGLQLFYQVSSLENNPWAGLGRILAVACANTEKHWCPQSFP